MNIWIFTEERADLESTLFKFQKAPGNCCTDGELREIPAAKFKKGIRIRSKVDQIITASAKANISISNYLPMFKRQFNTWVSI